MTRDIEAKFQVLNATNLDMNDLKLLKLWARSAMSNRNGFQSSSSRSLVSIATPMSTFKTCGSLRPRSNCRQTFSNVVFEGEKGVSTYNCLRLLRHWIYSGFNNLRYLRKVTNFHCWACHYWRWWCRTLPRSCRNFSIHCCFREAAVTSWVSGGHVWY